MSAYVVDREHIRFLVSAALDRGIIQHYAGSSGLTWHHGEDRHALPGGDWDRAGEVGQMLWDENIKGVLCRYPRDTKATMPGPVGESFIYAHQRRSWPRQITSVQVLKACDGYEYQACEDPDWERSEAFAFLNALRRAAWHALPGYDEAQWEVSERAPA